MIKLINQLINFVLVNCKLFLLTIYYLLLIFDALIIIFPVIIGSRPDHRCTRRVSR
jgi:hypothetical protein